MTFEERDIEGLMYLKWSMFDSPDQPGSGYDFMEREPVLLLDRAIHRVYRKSFTEVELGYASPYHAKMLGLTSNNPHRVGKAIKLKCIDPGKKFTLIEGLMCEYNEMKGGKLNHNGIVMRIDVFDRSDTVYFDLDNLKNKKSKFYVWY